MITIMMMSIYAELLGVNASVCTMLKETPMAATLMLDHHKAYIGSSKWKHAPETLI